MYVRGRIVSVVGVDYQVTPFIFFQVRTLRWWLLWRMLWPLLPLHHDLHLLYEDLLIQQTGQHSHAASGGFARTHLLSLLCVVMCK
ncbi:unnamed protein product [Leptosia nina]|uniref:Uncharacterized protein n=1 Tax=Leptosia nina TaxID=320188 RepID=A0AAV1JWE0_9NEOP